MHDRGWLVGRGNSSRPRGGRSRRRGVGHCHDRISVSNCCKRERRFWRISHPQIIPHPVTRGTASASEGWSSMSPSALAVLLSNQPDGDIGLHPSARKTIEKKNAWQPRCPSALLSSVTRSLRSGIRRTIRGQPYPCRRSSRKTGVSPHRRRGSRESPSRGKSSRAGR